MNLLANPWLWVAIGFAFLLLNNQRKKIVADPLIIQRAESPPLTSSDEAIFAMRTIDKRMEEMGVPIEQRTQWKNETALKLIVRSEA